MYYRKKNRKIIAEGKTTFQGKQKTIYLFTLPPIEILLKKSLFSSEKTEQINEKIKRLKRMDENSKKSSYSEDSMYPPKDKNLYSKKTQLKGGIRIKNP